MIASPDLPPPPQGKYPAKEHCRRVAKMLAERGGNTTDGVIYLQGQVTKMVEDDDQAMHFRQRRPFFYLTGCDVPDCHFIYDIDNDFSTLFIPPVEADRVIWEGLPLQSEEAMKKFEIDAVYQTTQLQSSVSALSSNTVFTIADRIPEDLTFSSPEAMSTDLLQPVIEDARVIKDDFEISLMRHANAVSSHAHTEVLKSATQASNERELHGLFLMHCVANGCRDQAYGCICASGPNAATLHYQHNDLSLSHKLNLLLDAGGEYSCYCADIT
ncbi:hypothetical protein LTR66_010860, partial [Elasticomyces elasticus]